MINMRDVRPLAAPPWGLVLNMWGCGGRARRPRHKRWKQGEEEPPSVAHRPRTGNHGRCLCTRRSGNIVLGCGNPPSRITWVGGKYLLRGGERVREIVVLSGWLCCVEEKQQCSCSRRSLPLHRRDTPLFSLSEHDACKFMLVYPCYFVSTAVCMVCWSSNRVVWSVFICLGPSTILFSMYLTFLCVCASIFV